MSSSGSVTELISRVKGGDGKAAQKLCELCLGELLGLVRKKYPVPTSGIADEEDVALSALASFFVGAEHGRFPELRDREDLWNLLVVITKRKAFRLLKSEGRQKRDRGGQQSVGHDLSPSPNLEAALANATDPKPTPEVQLLLEEGYERLLRALGDPQLRSIAIWKLEGYTEKELAAMLGCTERTIQRKLQLIRAIWQEEEVDERKPRSDR
jgi:DNA-directed RNA polymerase specialized sigma24 family protein